MYVFALKLVLETAGRDGNRLDIPVALGILIDGTIRAKFAHLRSTESVISRLFHLVVWRETYLRSCSDRLLNPLVFVEVRLIDHVQSSNI